MSDFAIQCPCCFEWTEGFFHEITVFRKNHLPKLLNALSKLKEVDKRKKHKGIIQCSSESWACPAPFEAVIYQAQKPLDKDNIIIPASWMDIYTFRLRKENHISRFDDYHVILFCTKRVERLPSVELGHLLSFDLMSKAIHGICAQVDSPVTIYAAKERKDKDGKDEVFWLPIEIYEKKRENPLLPYNYNDFCLQKRCMFYEHMGRITPIKKEGEEKEGLKLQACSLDFDDQCGKTVICWRNEQNLCPVFFVKKRSTYDTCYKSDWNEIKKIQNKWNKHKYEAVKIYEYQCEPTHFQERAIPIIVHDHLASVAFCGQAFDKRTIEAIKPKIECKFFDDHIDELEKAMKDKEFDKSLIPLQKKIIEKVKEDKSSWIKALSNTKKEISKTFFWFWGDRRKDKQYFLPEKLDGIAEDLDKNVEEIQKLANTRYIHLRVRTEYFFRREILQRIRKENLPVADVLNRMIKFWLFKIGIVLSFHYHTTSRQIKIHHFESPNRANLDGFDDNLLNMIKASLLDRKGIIRALLTFKNTLHFLYEGETKDKNRILLPSSEKNLIKIVKNLKIQMEGKEYTFEDSKRKFIVCVPFHNQIWLFVFIERDETALSSLRSNSDPQSISPLCRESIRETCIEVAHEFS